MTKTIYIAGPMTGLPEHNYPAFDEAARSLRETGYTVLNPAENPPPAVDPSWEDWMRAALGQVIQADGIALLPGWERSRGARLEVHVASALQITLSGVFSWINRAHFAWEAAHPLRANAAGEYSTYGKLDPEYKNEAQCKAISNLGHPCILIEDHGEELHYAIETGTFG